jgi:hypothetical protein
MRRLLKLLLGALAGVMVAAAVTRRLRPSVGDEESDALDLVAIFTGSELHSRAAAFSGGSILAWFGVCVVDLRDATPAPEMDLLVTSLFGVVVVTVPPTWRVRTGRWGFGPIVVDAPEPDSDDAPTLRLSIRAFAGVVVVDATDAAAEDDAVPAEAGA